ncbi:hypothetical protein ABTX60_03815 [Streptomyces sp. NPDC126510]|uniref:hypothetical protein n=1 Tax=Streptomyces sp. NPDC126510 TaxID=3155317 RepID=UPI00332197EF
MSARSVSAFSPPLSRISIAVRMISCLDRPSVRRGARADPVAALFTIIDEHAPHSVLALMTGAGQDV